MGWPKLESPRWEWLSFRMKSFEVAMWQRQYRKTFVGMQIMMWLVACAVLVRTRIWLVAVVFLAIMQVGAILGAVWAERLKRRLGGHAGAFR